MNKLIELAKRLLIIIIYCVGTIWIIIAVLAYYSRNSSSYVAASLDKEYRLRKVKSPRLIFVGGSNLALGLNSPLLSRKTGYNVVNMGLHAGLGLDFILNEAKNCIRPGDIVVLSIEHFLAGGNKKLLAQLISINPNSEEFLDLDILDQIRLFVSKLQLCISSTFYKLIGRDKDPHYYREAFNFEGDLIIPYNEPKPNLVGGSVKFANIDYSNEINSINSFIKICNKKGARTFFIFPAYQQSAYKKNIHTLQNLELQYRKYLRCPILGSVVTSVIQDKYFYDTVYHLDSIGIQNRTYSVFNMLNKEKVLPKSQ
ncbi:hypothetical protein G8759_04960 [Spirosoma aureum]|uniref:SGNH/GDSL hydrolase family protein n=1 Tax=Spirosoma aureum TaxID=2692134 RepID=A0A6G9AHV8_9BACT|nr:hypothetical protein [Spirosoma aureum]QIP12028.1 hypothetical protein G8759_04960 [Spirosoma aureum]